MNTLKRGYAIASLEGKVINDIKNVKKEDIIKIQLEKGNIISKVMEVNND